MNLPTLFFRRERSRMNPDPFLNAVLTSLRLGKYNAPTFPQKKVRITATGRYEVAIERTTDHQYRVTIGDPHSGQIHRSRQAASAEEAAQLFVDSVAAELIGFNLGATQDEFENRFDQTTEG